MKAQMVRQVDTRQVRTHQLVFIVGRCQQYFIAYLFSLDVGPLACCTTRKFFPLMSFLNGTAVPCIPYAKLHGL
jgi:hypothetical protein